MRGVARRHERREEWREERYERTHAPLAPPSPVLDPTSDLKMPPAELPAPPTDTGKAITPCKYHNCAQAATYGFADDSALYYCEKHKSDEMVLLVPAAAMPKCEFVRCTAAATFGFADDMVARYCRTHAAGNDMVEITAAAPLAAAPPARVSGSSLPFERLSALIREYEAASKQEAALAAETASASSNGAMAAEAHNKVKVLERDAGAIQHEIADTASRLERQEKKPSMGGRSIMGQGKLFRDDQKIASLQAELAELRKKEAACKAALERERQNLAGLQATGSVIAAKQAEQRSLQERRQQIFAEVVSHETEPVAIAAIAASNRARAEVSPQIRIMQVAADGIKHADAQLAQALAMEEQALRDNMGAAVFEGPAERVMQAQRDRLTQDAARFAHAGANELTSVIGQIPPQLISKFPAQLTGLRNVHLPELYTQRFGRTLAADFVPGGEAVNEIRGGCGIRENLEHIQRCRQIAHDLLRRTQEVVGLLQQEEQQYAKQVQSGEIALFEAAQIRIATADVTSGMAAATIAT